jgi:hypothetical protein
MDRFTKLACITAVALSCVGCPAGKSDPPPPEESMELASAAPRALGALAGGTDAAPPAVFPQRRPPEEPEYAPMPEHDFDAGLEPEDAGLGNGELPL